MSTKRAIRRLAQLFVLAIVAVVLTCTVGSYVSPSIAWRVRLLTDKLTGRIPQIPLPLLVKWSMPRSPVNLFRLSSTPNVNASIANTFDDRESGMKGEKIFGQVCAGCHGDDARGGIGPNLIAAIGGLSDWQFFSTVKWGRRGTRMRAQPLSDLEIWQVGAFIRQTALDAAVGKKYADNSIAAYRPVTTAMLRAGTQTGDWLGYSGDYGGDRHSPLTQITPANVGALRLAWVAQLPTDDAAESTPIVVGPWMFVTEQPEGVTALDARTGTVLWQFHRPLPDGIPQCCGEPNRGVAVFGNAVYVETFDAHLIALSAATGAQLWDTTVADWRHGYSMTSAPFVADGRIVAGVAGGDMGIRGFISAYSAATGAQLWRFYTVPAPGEPGGNSWGGDSWRHGGAAAWFNGGAYDPETGLLYFGTGNPGPIFSYLQRPGDNLYSDCLVALDVRTGKLRWYYQFTPADAHGWDSTEQPILADIDWQGQSTPVLLLANRNGFFYALDRRTGRFLFAKAFARQTWAAGFDASGRPIRLPHSDPTPNGTLISPPAWGATSWWSPSFDAARGLVFVPSVDSADLMFADKETELHLGRLFLGSGYQRAPDQPTTLALRAIDAATGEIRWNTVIDRGGGEIPGQMGGVLSTAGGVLFAGHSSEFDAYDAATGAVLWRTPLGSDIHAAPISYAIAGQQYVALLAGRTLFVFSLPSGQASPAARPATKRKPAARDEGQKRFSRRKYFSKYS
jgi:alcohol dehydrogenase (cytochrome c)